MWRSRYFAQRKWWALALGMLVVVSAASGAAGVGPLTTLFYRTTSVQANGGVVGITIQPIPEGPGGPSFTRNPTEQGARPLAEIERYVPDPLPPPMNQWFCNVGGDLKVELRNGTKVTYGPCYRPISIDRLWAEIMFIVSDGACSPKCGPSGADTPWLSSRQDDSCNLSTLQLGPVGFAPYGLARAGPVWFSAFGRVEPGAPATLSASGPYDGWKVVIHPDPASSGTVNLSGIQCSSGLAVRFCYETCDWSTRATRLQTSVAIQAVDVGRHLDYTGYMVFPGPGLMRLTASGSRGAIGTTVIEVPKV